jgi:nicotinamide-nucleotide amidase
MDRNDPDPGPPPPGLRPPLSAAVLAVGSELVLGQLVDTNSAWLSRFLSSRGLAVVSHQSCGDDPGRLPELYRRAWDLHDVVVATGGLGPTEDDLARQAVARAFGLRLEYRPELAAEIRRIFESRGYIISPNQGRQAWIPEGAEAVPNPWGTAPAFCLDRPGKLMMLLPGVPDEMRRIAGESLGPRLELKFASRLGLVRTTILRAAGLGEGMVDTLLGNLLAESVNPRLGLLAGAYETRVLVTTRGRGAAECDRLDGPVLAEIEARLGRHLVGRGDDTLAAVSARAIAERGLRLAIVDAATGGKAAAPFLEAVAPRHWAGALTVGPAGIGPGLELLLGELGADLVAVVSGAVEGPEPAGADGPAGSANSDGTAGSDAAGAADRGRPGGGGLPAGHVVMAGAVEIWTSAAGRGHLALRASATTSGPPGLVTTRFASLMAYHLWRHLTGRLDV